MNYKAELIYSFSLIIFTNYLICKLLYARYTELDNLTKNGAINKIAKFIMFELIILMMIMVNYTIRSI